MWQRAHELVLITYRLTAQFPSSEKFGLSHQMRRAAVSVASNIVEGFRRRTVRDSLNFYNTADGSLEELRYQFLLAYDLRYFDQDTFVKTDQLASEVGKMLHACMASQRRHAR